MHLAADGSSCFASFFPSRDDVFEDELSQDVACTGDGPIIADVGHLSYETGSHECP